MSAFELPPDWYLHHCERLALSGRSAGLPIEPPEPSNIHSIEAGRARRATRGMIRRRGEL
jgi:hypothetical protein